MENKLTRRESISALAAAGAIAAGIGFVRPAMAEATGAQITQTAEFGFDPEKKDAAREAIAKLVKAVEENEPGVLAYIAHFTEDNKAFFFEIYQDEASLKAHGSQPHMQEIRGAFASGLLKMPLKVVKLEHVAGFHRA